MNRLFLTLLALLTGLAAQVSPAQAAVVGFSEAEVGSVQASGALAQVALQAVARTTLASGILQTDLGPVMPLPLGAPCTLGVRIGIDRARE